MQIIRNLQIYTVIVKDVPVYKIFWIPYWQIVQMAKR